MLFSGYKANKSLYPTYRTEKGWDIFPKSKGASNSLYHLRKTRFHQTEGVVFAAVLAWNRVGDKWRLTFSLSLVAEVALAPGARNTHCSRNNKREADKLCIAHKLSASCGFYGRKEKKYGSLFRAFSQIKIHLCCWGKYTVAGPGIADYYSGIVRIIWGKKSL